MSAHSRIRTTPPEKQKQVLSLPIQAFVAMHSHERWDGGPEYTGAPGGKGGDEGGKWVEDVHRYVPLKFFISCAKNRLMRDPPTNPSPQTTHTHKCTQTHKIRTEANLRSLADMLEARTLNPHNADCAGIRRLDGPWLRCGTLGAYVGI